MKSRFWVYSLGLIIILVVLAIFLRSPRQDQPKAAPEHEAPQPVQTSGQPAKTNPNLGTATTANQSDASRATAEQTKATSIPQNRQERIKQADESKNVPIDFYGRVIDQDSNSLSGVKIDAKVRHWDATSFGSSIHIEKETDAQGRFEIHGITGDAIDFEAIQKSGHEPEPGQRTYGPTAGSPEDPAVFKMWATNTHEQLITASKSFDIVPDGRPYVIDLTKGTISESGGGDLKVWVKYAAQVTPGQTYDWSSEIDVMNGGLLQEESLNSPMYVAPPEGYVPAFQFQQQIKGGQRGSTGPRRFYLRLNNGQEYGRAAIQMFAPFNGRIPGLVRIDYAVNPSGSRTLR